MCLDLNFTHRSAYGTQGEGDQHGNLKELSEETMKQLQAQFPRCFAEPSYPVDRGPELNKYFEHGIDLVDESAPPPKRKLYPLDDAELAELKSQIEALLADGRI